MLEVILIFALASFCRFSHLFFFEAFNVLCCHQQSPLISEALGSLKLQALYWEEVQKLQLHLLLGEICNLHKDMGRNTPFSIACSWGAIHSSNTILKLYNQSSWHFSAIMCWSAAQHFPATFSASLFIISIDLITQMSSSNLRQLPKHLLLAGGRSPHTLKRVAKECRVLMFLSLSQNYTGTVENEFRGDG